MSAAHIAKQQSHLGHHYSMTHSRKKLTNGAWIDHLTREHYDRSKSTSQLSRSQDIGNSYIITGPRQ